MSQENDLERWLRGQIFRSREKPLEKFLLFNGASMSTRSSGGPIEEFEMPSEQLSGEQIPIMKDQILQAAQRDADTEGSKLQTYFVVALEMGAKTGPRHRFRVRGEGEEDDIEDGKPTQSGLVSQLMRHNEAMMRTMVQAHHTTVSLLTRQNEMLADTNAKLMIQRQEAFLAIEEAKSNQADRELQLLMAGNEEERKTEVQKQVMGKLNALFPIIINKMAGKNLLNEQETSVLREFASGLQPEQLQGIMQHLSNEQKITLLSLIKEIQKEN